MSAPGTVGGCGPSTVAVNTTATAVTTVSPPATAAALRGAAARGDLPTCQRLLGTVRSVRFSRDADGRSALHLAASGGHTGVVRLLLDVAAPREVDSPDGAGCTALQRAAADGHEEVVRLALARGADIDRHDSVVSGKMSTQLVYTVMLVNGVETCKENLLRGHIILLIKNVSSLWFPWVFIALKYNLKNVKKQHLNGRFYLNASSII